MDFFNITNNNKKIIGVIQNKEFLTIINPVFIEKSKTISTVSVKCNNEVKKVDVHDSIYLWHYDYGFYTNKVCDCSTSPINKMDKYKRANSIFDGDTAACIQIAINKFNKTFNC